MTTLQTSSPFPVSLARPPSEMQSPPESPHPHTMMTSDEVDWLVYSYLQESGKCLLYRVTGPQRRSGAGREQMVGDGRVWTRFERRTDRLELDSMRANLYKVVRLSLGAVMQPERLGLRTSGGRGQR